MTLYGMAQFRRISRTVWTRTYKYTLKIPARELTPPRPHLQTGTSPREYTGKGAYRWFFEDSLTSAEVTVNKAFEVNLYVSGTEA